MERKDFRPETFSSSGAFCSNLCDKCPVAELTVDVRAEAAMTVDEVLEKATPETLRYLPYMKLVELVRINSQFSTGFMSDFPIAIDKTVEAVEMIARGECSNYKLSE